MSATVTLNTPLMSREERDSINNLLEWCIRATFVLLVLCALLDSYAIAVFEDWYLSNHPGMRQDEAAMLKFAIYTVLLLLIVLLIQAPLIFFGATPIILTFARGPSVAKRCVAERWVVNAVRDGGDIEMGGGLF